MQSSHVSPLRGFVEFTIVMYVPSTACRGDTVLSSGSACSYEMILGGGADDTLRLFLPHSSLDDNVALVKRFRLSSWYQ